jgi:hypothetical protein
MRVILGLVNIVVGRIIIGIKMNVYKILSHEHFVMQNERNENQQLMKKNVLKGLLLQ